MTRNLEVMKESVQAGLSPEKSPTGLTGGDAAKLDAYIKNGKTLADSAVLGAARNAMQSMNLTPRWAWFVPHLLLDQLVVYLLF